MRGSLQAYADAAVDGDGETKCWMYLPSQTWICQYVSGSTVSVILDGLSLVERVNVAPKISPAKQPLVLRIVPPPTLLIDGDLLLPIQVNRTETTSLDTLGVKTVDPLPADEYTGVALACVSAGSEGDGDALTDGVVAVGVLVLGVGEL